jgi:hypothetical protein
LRKGIQTLPCVMVFDNDDLSNPYRKVAVFSGGKAVSLSDSLPAWLTKIVKEIGR